MAHAAQPIVKFLASVLLPAMAVSVSTLSAGAASPQPRSLYQSIPAFDVLDTPAEFDRIAFVRHWFGPPDPEPAPAAVLILVPGFFGGAEDFRYVGTRLVARLPWLQVWAVDRRNNFPENSCGMELAQALHDATIAIAYYILRQSLPGCPPPDDPDEAVWNGAAEEFALSQAEAASLGMAAWGLAAELEDMHRLVAFAHGQYPRAKVFLGGHSLGGMTAQLYAGWRFGETSSTAGWRTIDGIVLVDGAVDSPNWSALILQSFGERALMAGGMIYWDLLPASPLLGHFAEIGAMATSFDPASESLLWQSLPGPLAWPDAGTCPTNKALFASFSDESSPVEDFRMHQGSLAVPVDLNGDGRLDTCAVPNESRFLAHWRGFDQTSPPELASTDVWARAVWESTITNAVEWYFSIALNADIDLASNLDSTEPFISPLDGTSTTAQAFGHRVLDTAGVRVPVYAFVAAECRDRFDRYQTVATSVPEFTVIDHSAETCPQPSSVPYAHLDPLFAADTRVFVNAFIVSLSDWLRVHR